MRIKFITPLILAIGLLTVAQPSFAMKRSHSGMLGHHASQALAMMETAGFLVVIVAANPFFELPNEVLRLIFRWVGPQGRLLCRVVNRQLWEFLSAAQEPASVGFGWTDTLPLAITPQVNHVEPRPIIHDGIHYLADFEDSILLIVDPQTNDVIQEIPLTMMIFRNTAVGEMVYMSRAWGTTITVMHRSSQTIVSEIEVGQSPYAPIAHGGLLFVSGVFIDDHKLSVIDPNTNQVMVEVQLPDFIENGELAYVVHGDKLILFGDRCVAFVHLGGYLPGQH